MPTRQRTIDPLDDWLTSAARLRPHRVAIEAPEGALTYAALDAAADVAARRLRALGVGEGDRVAATLAPSLHFCALFHALPRLGAAIVPLNTRLPALAQAEQARVAGALMTVDRALDGLEAPYEPGATADPEATYAVLFTSGTSGQPRPIALTTANLEAAAAASAAALGSEPSDRWLCALPLFHIAGLSILVRAARAGATAVLHREFRAAAVHVALAFGEITLASLVATQLRRLLELGTPRAPQLRALLLGGGPIPPDLVDRARSSGLPVRCTYGMTETGSQVAVSELWDAGGVPVEGARIELAADGEILVGGPMVAPGARAPDGLLHTGDVGRLDRAGRLHVDGRIGELIVTGGEKVAPSAVEAVLLAHPAVLDAAVAGRPDPEWGEAVTAFVVERRAVGDYELLAFCRERLAGYQTPKQVVRVAALPRNAAGKLLRGELGL